MITPAAMTGLGAPSFLHRMPRPGALVARVALDRGAQEHRAVPSVLVRPPSPISEFEKLEGCVTCLSVRLRD